MPDRRYRAPTGRSWRCTRRRLACSSTACTRDLVGMPSSRDREIFSKVLVSRHPLRLEYSSWMRHDSGSEGQDLVAALELSILRSGRALRMVPLAHSDHDASRNVVREQLGTNDPRSGHLVINNRHAAPCEETTMWSERCCAEPRYSDSCPLPPAGSPYFVSGRPGVVVAFGAGTTRGTRQP